MEIKNVYAIVYSDCECANIIAMYDNLKDANEIKKKLIEKYKIDNNCMAFLSIQEYQMNSINRGNFNLFLSDMKYYKEYINNS